MAITASTISALISLPDQPSLILVSNHSTKECLIYFTTSAIRKVTEIICSVKANTHTEKEFYRDIENLDFKVLETLEDETILKIYTKYFKDKLLDNGYKILNNRVFIRPFIRTTYGIDHNSKDRIFVELVSHDGKKRQVVGIFEKRTEAKEFVKEYYKAKPYFPVIANNILTKEYLLWYSTHLDSRFRISF